VIVDGNGITLTVDNKAVDSVPPPPPPPPLPLPPLSAKHATWYFPFADIPTSCHRRLVT
jgi:hypothetical protein